jgi:ribosome-associated heat shock protein Hsp15
LPEQRLDKWLWCARVVKTRSGAARLIADGKVRINGERTLKPSRLVHSGDVVTTAYSGRLAVMRVIDIAERRGPASLAQTLYEDLTPEAPPDTGLGTHRLGKRPTKRDRRRLDAFRGSDGA